MRTFLLLLPAGLSTLVLAAHFLRRGSLPATLLCFALLTLLWRRRPWARRVLQGALVLGALEWAWTLLNITAARRAEGEPWLRMAIILGAVAAVALLGAALLETAPMRKRFEAGNSQLVH